MPGAMGYTGDMEPARPDRVDTLWLPLLLAGGLFALYVLTATGFHTFDGIAYVRDMGKAPAAMVLPHHLFYEPLALALYHLGQALGWSGPVERPAQTLSSLAGAGGVALVYRLAWLWSRTRAVALPVALALAFSYGYWFYSVEIEIYALPLCGLLAALTLVDRVSRGGVARLCWAAGACHAAVALVHQATLLIVPAFVIGLALIPGLPAARLGRVGRYGLALAGIVGVVYLFAGIVIAGQSTPDRLLRWINTAGETGTWGAWRTDSLDLAWRGLTAAASADFWTGRVLIAALLSGLALALGLLMRRGGAVTGLLSTWVAIYSVFFIWWDPENLKFWVWVLPALLLLAVRTGGVALAAGRVRVTVALAGSLIVVALLLTDAPVLWARRDPLADPARQEAAALGRLTAPEDLIVLQAGSVETHLPLYYGRANLISARELWYTEAGAAGRPAAVVAIQERIWHALAKGATVWIEDRVLTPGPQQADHYVFSPTEIATLRAPYGAPVPADVVPAGPALFQRLDPRRVTSPATAWDFHAGPQGWSAVNLGSATVDAAGWCVTPEADPAFYGPPLSLDNGVYRVATIRLRSVSTGPAQLFYRADPAQPYDEAQSVTFAVTPGLRTYTVPLALAPAWRGPLRGLRFDPLPQGDAALGAANRICLESLSLLP